MKKWREERKEDRLQTDANEMHNMTGTVSSSLTSTSISLSF